METPVGMAEPRQEREKGNISFIPSNNNFGSGQHYNPISTYKASRLQHGWPRRLVFFLQAFNVAECMRKESCHYSTIIVFYSLKNAEHI